MYCTRTKRCSIVSIKDYLRHIIYIGTGGVNTALGHKGLKLICEHKGLIKA